MRTSVCACWLVSSLALSACRGHFDARGDGGPGDGSGADADQPHNVVFFTSAKHTNAEIRALGGGDMLAGGDALCAQAAAAGGHAGTFRALLSDATTNAIDRLAGARGWFRLDGLPFADSATELFGSQHVLYPILFDETGTAQLTTQVMTGTGTDGKDSGDCNHWTTVAPTVTVVTGNTTDGGYGWSSRYIPGCDAALHVYCFQIDHVTPVTFVPVTGRRAFVSQPWLPGGGLASADMQCMQEAQQAGLTGNYLALLATTTASAMSRFSLSGEPWVRVDGIPVVRMAGDLATRKLIAALDEHANGVVVNGTVFTGATDPTMISAAVATSCGNWSNTASTAVLGVATDGAETFFTESYTGACNGTGPMYCLEQ